MLLHKRNLCLAACVPILVIFCCTQPLLGQMTPEEFRILLDSTRSNNQMLYKDIHEIQFTVHAKAYMYFGFRPLAIRVVPLLQEYQAEGRWFQPDSVYMRIFAHRIIIPEESKINADSLLAIFSIPNPMRFNYSAFALKGDHRRREEKDASPSLPSQSDSIGNGNNRDGIDVKVNNRVSVKVKKRKREKREEAPLPLLSPADSIYHFEQKGFMDMGTIRAIAVKVMVKDGSQPGVYGTLWIDERRFVVVRAELAYNRASMDLNPRFGEANRKVFYNRDLYSGRYWFPDEVNEEVDVKLFGMNIRMQRTLHYSDYKINIITRKKQQQPVIMDIDSAVQELVFPSEEYPNTITPEEEEEIMEYFEDEFYTGNLLPGMEDMESLARQAVKKQAESLGGRTLQIGLGLSRFLNYNRVEGPRVSLGRRWAGMFNKINALHVEAGYGFEDYQWKGKLEMLQWLGTEEHWFLGGSIYDTYIHNTDSEPVGTLTNSLASLLFKSDYYDLYRARGGWMGGGWRPMKDFGASMRLYREEHRTITDNTGFSLMRRSRDFRPNPPVFEGINQALLFSMYYRPKNLKTAFAIERAWKEPGKGDFAYTRFWFDVTAHTRLTRSLRLVNHLQAGIAAGAVPPQRWFDYGGIMPTYLEPSLRGTTYHAYTGDRMIQNITELQLSGRYLRKYHIPFLFSSLSQFYLWGGAGWSDLTEKSKALAAAGVPLKTAKKTYLEAGIGFGDTLRLGRLDLIVTNRPPSNFLIRFRFFQ